MNRISLETKDATDDQFNVVTELCKENSKSTVLKMLIDAYIEKQNRKTGTRQSTLDNIDQVVKAQMALNASTDKIITAGNGQNAVKVKYEQRAITAKWIMKNANCGLTNALGYLKQHETEINKHHKEVLKTDDVDFFNRRVGRATGKVTA
jgi:hypothetical protein